MLIQEGIISGGTLQDINNLSPSILPYVLAITDTNNCITMAQVMVSEPTVLSLMSNSNDISCVGICDGFVAVAPSGGVGPYGYLWDDPLNQANQTALALTAGTYTVTITDSIGCTITGSHTLNDPLPISTSITTVDETNFGACDGSISVIASGGVLPYSYSWNNGSTSSSNTGLCSGIYSVTLTDDNGCEVILSEAVNGPGCMAQVDFNNRITSRL